MLTKKKTFIFIIYNLVQVIHIWQHIISVCNTAKNKIDALYKCIGLFICLCHQSNEINEINNLPFSIVDAEK